MEQAQTIHRVSHRRQKISTSNRHRPRKKRIAIWIIFFSLLIIIPLALFCVVVILFQVNELNLPNVLIYDKNVGLMSRDQTVDYLNKTWNLNRQVRLVSAETPESSYSLQPAELGLWVDPAATALAANKLGRASNPFSEILAAIKGQKQIVLPILYFNEEVAQANLTRIAEELTIPPQNASILFQDGVWSVAPSYQGQTLDVEATIDLIYKNAFNFLIGQSLPLQMKYLEPSIKDLTGVLAEIDALLTKEFRFEAYDPITDEYFVRYVPDEIKKTWVIIEPQTYQVQFDIKREDVFNLLTNWEHELGEGRSLENAIKVDELIEAWHHDQTVSVPVSYLPTTYVVEPGESLWMISLKLGIPMWYILDANEGLTTSNLTAGMRLIIPPKDILLPLPVVRNKRIRIDICEQTMRIFENGQVIHTHKVSTGMSDSPTMTGVFQILTHELNAYASNWDLYMPHFMGIYEAWPGFMNGIHGLPLLASGQRLWASNLGSPASYGCIILDLTAAENLYYWADPGVVVEIIQ